MARSVGTTRRWSAAVLVAVLAAGCSGGGADDATTTSTLPPTTSTTTSAITTTTGPAATTTTGTAPPSTSTTTTTTEPPDLGDWSEIDVEAPVTPPGDGVPAIGPASPTADLPGEGWPVDGHYALRPTRLDDEPGRLLLEIRRWIPCDDAPERCPSDPPADGIATEADMVGFRELDLADDDLTVVIFPIGDGPALEGTGADLATVLLGRLDAAFVDWIWEPSEAGDSAQEISTDLRERSEDPGFPFGPEPSTGVIAFRGPLETYLAASPGALLGLDEWPPSVFYGWFSTLEVRDGDPIMYLHADEVSR